MKHLLLLMAVFAACIAHAAAEKPKLLVYHKLTPKDDFIKRGEITYGSDQEPSYTHTSPDVIALDTSSPHSLYQVKIVDEASKDVVLSSVKSCQLAASGFKDHFIVHVNESGDFTHVDYYSAVSDCFDGAPTENTKFISSVKVTRPDHPIKPALVKLTGISQKSQQAATEEGDEADKEPEEKTFFQKYWYVLLGMAVLFVTSAGQDPPATQAASARR